MAGSQNQNAPQLADNRDFRLLWLGQGLSQVGTQITVVALPLLAVVTLEGTPLEVSGLVAVEYLPSLLLGLLAGLLVDRMERRSVMLVSDFGRFLLLGAVASTALADVLDFPLLYVLVALVGVLTLCYDVAYQSGLPSLVHEDHLLAANSRLQSTQAVASGAGPALGGTLAQAVTAPFALLVDAVSYLLSGMTVARLSRIPAEPAPAQRIREQLREGLAAIRADSLQWRLLGTAAVSNFFGAGIVGVYVLYVVRELDVSSFELGCVFAAGAAGAVVGGMLAMRLTARSGPRLAILTGLAVSSLGDLMVVLARGPHLGVLLLLAIGQLLGQGGMVVVGANAMAWRQQVTPRRLLGRVLATARTVNFGVAPLGALALGGVATLASPLTALVLGAVGTLSAVLWLATGRLAGREPSPHGEPPVVPG